MLRRFKQKEKREQCNTHSAAYIRLVGIDIMFVTNQRPIVSPNIIIIIDIKICILILDEKIFCNFSLLFFPNSKVIKRLIEEDMAPEITENIVTTPPTTLYIP